MAISHATAFRNRVLGGLTSAERAVIADQLEEQTLRSGAVLCEPGDILTHVWFPETGVASLLAVEPDGSQVETGTVGYEGLIGLPLFLGSDRWPGRIIWQVPGTAYRMSRAAFQLVLRGSPGFARGVGVAAELQMVQMAQSVACNRLHPVEQRLARWLLMTHDRAGSDTFSLTQEFLALMLGIRRASVSDGARRLRDTEVLTYRRGIVTVLDRPALEAAACPCYAIVEAEASRLMASG